MPRNPSLVCAVCGELMWKGTTSLPQGQATCRPCRRARKPTREVKPLTCKDCGGSIPSWRHWYCEPCAAKHRKHGQDKDRLTSEERGYGTAHRIARTEYLERFAPGDPCSRCEEPMYDDPSMLDLDHNDERTGYLGLAHRACNRSHGGRPRWKIHESACDECGITYMTAYPEQRFCSKPCRVKAQAEQRRQQAEQRRAARLMSMQVLAFKVCPICNAMHARSKYCSEECYREGNARQNRDRYRQRMGLPVDPLQPTAPRRSRVGSL